MSTRSERAQRELNLFREPEFMDDLCDQVASGATLYSVAKHHDIRYSKLFQWVKADQNRADAYEEALEARDANISDRVLTGVLAVTGTTVKDLLNDDGTPKEVSKLGEEAAFAVSEVGVSYDENGRVSGKKVKAHDKLRALEMMGRTRQMFTDKLAVSGAVTLDKLVGLSMAKDTANES